MKSLSFIGKLLFALSIAFFGIGHFGNAQAMAGFVPSFIPGGIFWVYLTGAALIAAAVSIVTGKYVKLAGILLGAMLLIFALTIHLPGLSNPQMAQFAMVALVKDIALAGASFYIAALSTESATVSVKTAF
ncbi:MAG: DoxX family protein [Cytophagaceae bacterium]|nr:DoxX family protein [Cytophagaceae bacterium]